MSRSKGLPINSAKFLLDFLISENLLTEDKLMQPVIWLSYCTNMKAMWNKWKKQHITYVAKVKKILKLFFCALESSTQKKVHNPLTGTSILKILADLFSVELLAWVVRSPCKTTPDLFVVRFGPCKRSVREETRWALPIQGKKSLASLTVRNE